MPSLNWGNSTQQQEFSSVPVESLTDLALDWAVLQSIPEMGGFSQVTNWVQKSKEGGGLLLKKGGFCSPSRDLEIASRLMDKHEIAVRKSKGLWYAMASKNLGDGQSASWNKMKCADRYGPMSYQINKVLVRFESSSLAQAICRCVVGETIRGSLVSVPSVLLDLRY